MGCTYERQLQILHLWHTSSCDGLVLSPSQLFNVSRRKAGLGDSHVRNIMAASYLMNVGKTTAGMLPTEDRELVTVKLP